MKNEMTTPVVSPRRAKPARPTVLAFEPLEVRTLYSTAFVVTNALDSGAGTLRDAITQSNATPGADTIAFNIPGGASSTIKLDTALPDLTDVVFIDGGSQPGFTSAPVIRLNGEALPAGADADGLRFAAGSSGSILRALSINRFDNSAVEIEAGVSGVTVIGNWLGLTDDGTGSFIDGQGTGVQVSGSNNTIGGTSAASRNVISGNAIGVSIQNVAATGNIVSGNFIGTSAKGTDPVGNELAGVAVIIQAANNTIGGLAAGAGNVIAGNEVGVILANDVHDNAVQGNLIGLNVDGAKLGNVTHGVLIDDESTANLIGGATAAARNVISGNGDSGVALRGGSTANTVQGNYIGTNVAGTDTIGNAEQGVSIFELSAANTVADNVIAGNAKQGVVISDANGTVLTGNRIGTNNSGAILPNGGSGVSIGFADGTVIGGNTAAAANVISANALNGIAMASAHNTTIAGNRIGTDPSGSFAIGNGHDGILVTTNTVGVTIGGTAPGAGNVISGNSEASSAFSGVRVSGAVKDVVVQGNIIGTNAAGTQSLSAANFAGVTVENTLSSGAEILIGGDTPAARNLISGNQRGVFLDNANAVNIFGNYIGTNLTGTTAVPNVRGVEIVNTSEFNNVGDSNPAHGNLISGNTSDGVIIQAPVNAVLFNRIGTDAGGNAKLPNGGAGVHVAARAVNVEGNVISGNKAQGILVEAGSDDSVIDRNRIGTNADGTAALGNDKEGILAKGSDRLRIGSPSAGTGNLVSGNGSDGINLTNVADSDVKSNFIGTNAAGTAAIGNALDGLFITGVGSNGNRIGGTNAGAGNLVSGNGVNGIDLAQAGSFNIIQGNKIGTDITGTTAISNFQFGIRMADTNSNLVGGSVPEAANVIAFNGGAGVKIDIGNQNSVRQNSIFSNRGIGIDIAETGVTPNDPLDTDDIGNRRQNFPVLTSANSLNGQITLTGAINSTPNKTFLLDFYANTELDGIGGSEGRTYLGAATVTTDANGNASFSTTIAKAVAGGQFVTATASTIDGDPFVDTSEFSSPVKVIAKPSITIGDVTLTEGKKGQKAFTFTVTLSAPSASLVSVNFATENGTATSAGKDFVAKSGTITFNPGETIKTVTIMVTGDTKKEADETFFVNLTSPVNADLLDAQATGVIKNDD